MIQREIRGLNQELQAKGSTNEEIFIFSSGIEYLGSIVPSFSITPYLHLQYAYDHINAYTETGAGIYDLTVQAQDIHSFLSSLGARFDYMKSWANCDLVFEIDSEWVHEYLNSSRTILSRPLSITGIPTPISTVGAPRNSGLVALDLLFTFYKKWQLEADGVVLFNDVLYDTSFFLSIGRLF